MSAEKLHDFSNAYPSDDLPKHKKIPLYILMATAGAALLVGLPMLLSWLWGTGFWGRFITLFLIN